MPDTPNTSVATLASLILAVSSSFRVRFRSVTVGERLAELQRPLPQRLVADHDAASGSSSTMRKLRGKRK